MANLESSSLGSTGLFATARIVGREKQLERIFEIVKKEQEYPKAIISIIDEGGAGKTKLLEETLRRTAGLPNVVSAREPIDFYLMPPHIRYGLADGLFNVLKQAGTLSPQFDELSEQVERARVLGDATSAAKIRDQAVVAYEEYFKGLASQKRMVAALDTAERIVYDIPGMPSFIADVADSWKWLLSFLPQLSNFVILLAGREQARRLLDELPSPKVHKEEIILGPLTEPEVIEYFDVLAETARTRGRDDVATRIAKVTRDQRQVVWKLSEGKPISLSLFADLISLESPVPAPFQKTLSELEAQSLDELDQMRKGLNELLINRLIENRVVDQPLLGDTIRAMGRATRGVNVKLLQALLDCSEPAAEQSLRDFSYLSIARKRRLEAQPKNPSEAQIVERWFLHDEMYKLLGEHIYRKAEDADEEREAAERIQKYYQERTAVRRKELDDIFDPVEKSGAEPDMDKLSYVESRRRNLLTEDVYYRLKHDGLNGFRWYYRYSRQATLSGETEIDFRLQSVLLEYISERQRETSWANDPESLDLSQVFGIIAMRPIVRYWAEQKYDLALEEVKRYRRDGQELLAQGAPGSPAILDIWEAYLLTTRGGDQNLHAAEQILNRVLDELRPNVSTAIADDLKLQRPWRTKAIYALGHRVRGYLYRSRGQLRRAVKDYTIAARLWRDLDILAEQAETLNSLSYVLTLLGEFGDARALVKNAIGLRRFIGPRYPVGLSLNTLAIVSLYEGNYGRAVRETNRALALFRGLRHRRGIGLSFLNLAEALRRQSQTDDVPENDKKIIQLREARRHATEALDIFQLEARETLYEVTALVELGCIHRDWGKVVKQMGDPNAEVLDLSREAQSFLERAATRAGTQMLYLKVDALVNLAWLGYFVSDMALIQRANLEAQCSFPPNYYLNPNTGKPEIDPDDAEVQLFSQMGKLNTLVGNLAFNRFDLEEKKKGNRDQNLMREALAEAAYHYTLGLAYNHVMSATYRDVRRAEDEIYERVKKLNPRELKIVADKVSGMEKGWNLGKSAMRELLEHRTIWFGD